MVLYKHSSAPKPQTFFSKMHPHPFLKHLAQFFACNALQTGAGIYFTEKKYFGFKVHFYKNYVKGSIGL